MQDRRLTFTNVGGNCISINCLALTKFGISTKVWSMDPLHQSEQGLYLLIAFLEKQLCSC